MAEYINKTDLLADILDEECRSEKVDSINALFWFARFVQRQPVADVVPRCEVEKAKQDVAREIFKEIEENLNNLIRYYKEKRKYATEVDYNEAEQRYCDTKIRTFEERLLRIAKLKKKYIGE